ncbi:cytochrome c1 [Sphingomonas sp.]|uniref:cytochrome c1 n=1 Tax=Sphingomonas sp. TaxID=28214 RepID=UPI001AFE4B8B|nr:cytochrome c1 [Sphingomonas sp.]MBO9713636.1 cytochrome c1 [Sphingomonas sp.]
MFSLFIRSIKFLVGAAFTGVLLWALLWTVVGLVTSPPEKTAEEWVHETHELKEVSFASDGPFGRFDPRQIQRGFQVYKEVCSSCHSLSLVAFRDLKQLGYSDAQVKKIAKDWAAKQPVQDPKAGTWGERDNTPADHIPHVYYPGQGSPPDLSLVAKARHGGGAYIYSLLTGYEDKQPAELLKNFPGAKTPDGLFYNPYFANLNIAMPEPLKSTGQVTYLDGTVATKDQMAKDVSAFLVWTAEPTMQARHRYGVAVVLFLLFATILGFGAYRTVWAGVKH